MKYINILTAIAFLFILSSCDKEDEHEHEEDTEYEYHAHITSPSNATKILGETLTIKVDFESHTGETVHHVNVVMHEKDDANAIIFSEPGEAHIHATSGNHTFEKTIVLSAENGISAHHDYTVKASVWGATDGEELEEEEVTFHVHEN